ncbi:MAG: alpha-amylase/4-alpha-glucanotransferase domain-containing protein [Pirellulaceae bacterium]
MTNPLVRLCLVLHNHQPIGNFDSVFEQAYQDSYLPFLEVFEPYEHLRISLHTSGCLLQWLDQHHPEYLDRLAALVGYGRVEIVGGAFYEPILTMIPSRDRIGQVRSYTRYLERRLAANVRGIWIPERVWESSLTNDLAAANIQYTVLDDYHFRSAGLDESQLTGYFVTEDQGRCLSVFPGSERLRYLIPFQEPSEAIQYCREMGESHPGCTLVFGDDGEKFGTWPETKQHVYQNGWLKRFFDALTENRDWLKTSTLADVVDQTDPEGKIYLPDASYREMTEWVLPVEQQHAHHDLVEELKSHERYNEFRNFIRGGFWRNFKIKYPESNEMYARMIYVSQLAERAESDECPAELVRQARQWLYQGQCNCSYWHGAFGGVYLPHLRNAVFQNLIAAENVLESWIHDQETWIDATAADFNFDGFQEVRLANDQLVMWVSPQQGGWLYELDVRKNGHNLLATIQRRPEAYHSKILDNLQANTDSAASIHDRVVLKRDDLADFLQYDERMRKSLIDHFWSSETTMEDLRSGKATELGDYCEGAFQSTIRRNPDRIQLLMTREGKVAGHTLKMTKGITFNSGSHDIEVAYMLENLPAGFECQFGCEFNFSGMPDGQDDRYFSTGEPGQRLGQLGESLELQNIDNLSLHDEWLGLVVSLHTNQPEHLWAFPVGAVSQSEAGFELVHQSVAVYPVFRVAGDEHGRWSTKMRLSVACGRETRPATGLQELTTTF